MSLEAFNPAPIYTVSGTGPYAITHPYRAAADVTVTVRANGVSVVLAQPGDYTVSPASTTTTGNVTLSSTAAALHAGKQLIVDRNTRIEQGWVGTQGAREKSLELQLDRLAMGIQEVQTRTLTLAGQVATQADPMMGMGAYDLVLAHGAVGNGVANDLAAFTAAELANRSPMTVRRAHAASANPTQRRIAYELTSDASVTIPGGWFPRYYHKAGATPFTQKINFAADNPSVPVQHYAILADAHEHSSYMINQWGWQEADTDGNLSGAFTPGKIPGGRPRMARTGVYQRFFRLLHSGEGDGYNVLFNASAQKHGRTDADVTWWAGQQSTGFASGQALALTNKVNLYGFGDFVLDDAGFADVAMFGHVTFLKRAGADSGDYAIPRLGHLIASTGAQPIDAALIVRGPMFAAVDLSGGSYGSGAAVVLAAGQKIELGATGVDPAATGKFSVTSVPGTDIGVASSEVKHRIAGTERLAVKAAGINVNGIIEVGGVKVVGSRITGWTAATGTGSRATFNTETATTLQCARALKQLIDDLFTHGAIGA